MPDLIDPELTKTDMGDEVGVEENEEEEKEPSSPYISPFFVNPNASPPPCRKHWDLLADECSNLVSCIILSRNALVAIFDGRSYGVACHKG